MFFVGLYTTFGDLQKLQGKSEDLVNEKVTVTKEVNGLIFFKIDNETGERKIAKDKLNTIRDFGTSLYGVFEEELSDDKAKELILKKLVSRMSETQKLITKIVNNDEQLQDTLDLLNFLETTPEVN